MRQSLFIKAVYSTYANVFKREVMVQDEASKQYKSKRFKEDIIYKTSKQKTIFDS